MKHLTNFSLNDVSINRVPVNPHILFVREEVKKWVSDIIDEPWVDQLDFSGLIMYQYIQTKDKDRLVKISKFMVFLSMLDDYLDKHESESGLWKNVFRNKRRSGNTVLEKLFESIWLELEPVFTPLQQERFMDSLVEWADLYPLTQQLKNGGLMYSPGEYVDLRRKDIVLEPFWILAEYGLSLHLDKAVLSLDIVKKFHQYADTHIAIFNDLISFKKEYITNGGKFNYVSVMSETYQCSFEQAATMIKNEISLLEEQILLASAQITESDVPIPPDYLSEVMNIVYGAVNWSKETLRYKSIQKEEFNSVHSLHAFNK